MSGPTLTSNLPKHPVRAPRLLRAWLAREAATWSVIAASPSSACVVAIVACALAVPFIAFADESLLRDAVEGRVQAMREYVELLKWGSGVACVALSGAVGLLWRALAQERQERIAALEAARTADVGQIKEVTAALVAATSAMNEVTAKLGALSRAPS